MKATLIYNPLAGPADMQATIHAVAKFWQNKGWQTTLRPTRYAGHAVALAREAAVLGERLVLAVGGDGTLGEVANGLANSETIMAPLPAGTGNSFGKELRMPRPNLIDRQGLLKAAEALAGGRVHRMDLGRFEKGKYWLLWTGSGIDSYVVAQMEPRSKLSKRLGPAGYAAEAFSQLPRFREMEATVEVDGREYSGSFVTVIVSNCRRYAGGEVILNPEAVLDDGFFEVFLFRGRGTAIAVRYLWEVWRGEHQADPGVLTVRGQSVKVETEWAVPIHTDGDPAGHTPFRCHVVPGALQLLVPTTAPADLFTMAGQSL